jgi:hypothetical protein
MHRKVGGLRLTQIYLGAVAFGLTLLIASLVLGGKDAHAHDGHADGADVFGVAPVTSLRFWVFLLAFGGGAGLALTWLGSSVTIAAIGAVGIGWIAGAGAVAIISTLRKNSVSSELGATELVGTNGTLLLPCAPGKPGKVRVNVKGRAEDFVANVVDEGEALPTGASVLIVAEGDHGSLLVAKAEM